MKRKTVKIAVEWNQLDVYILAFFWKSPALCLIRFAVPFVASAPEVSVRGIANQQQDAGHERYRYDLAWDIGSNAVSSGEVWHLVSARETGYYHIVRHCQH